MASAVSSTTTKTDPESLQLLVQESDKVNNWIIAGRIFMGIGLIAAIAAGGLFIAHVTVAAETALGSAVVGLALGSIGLAIGKLLTPNSAHTDRRRIQRLPVAGIENGGNNCFLNALMQMTMKSPLLRRFFNSRQSLPAFKDFAKQYDFCKNSGQALNAAYTQNIRLTLRALQSEAIEERNFSLHGQEDAIEAFNLIRNSIPDDFLGLEECREVTFIEEKTGWREGEAPFQKVLPYADLDIKPDQTFEEAMNEFHTTKPAPVEYDVEKIIKTRGWIDWLMRRPSVAQRTRGTETKLTKTETQYVKAPEEIFVHLKRFDFQKNAAIKKQEDYEVPEVFTLKQHNQLYQLDSVIKHIGNSARDGHYVSYINDNGTWYLCNDSYVQKISAKEVENALKQGYMYHFKKVTEQVE